MPPWLQSARLVAAVAIGSFGVAAGSHLQHSHKYMKKTTVIVSLGLLTFIVVGLLVTRTNSDSRELSQAEFTAMVQSNLLAKVRVYYPAEPGKLDGVPVMLHRVRGTFYQIDAAGQILKTQGVSEEFPFIARVHLTAELEGTLTRSSNFSAVSPNPLAQQVSKWFVHSK